MEEQFTVQGIHGNSTMNRAAYEEYQQALKARQLEGRYTLEEAAQFVANNSNADARSIFTKLEKSAKTGELTIHWPGSDEVYKSEPGSPQVMNRIILRGFEEAYWDDLNEWLKNNEQRLECKFPDPNFDKEFWEDEVKRNGGRYPLTVAAWFIADRANAGVNSMMHKLLEAARANEGRLRLTVYEPGKNVPYQFSAIQNLENEVRLEAYWDDLNEWLGNNLPRLDCEFPDPAAPAAKGDAEAGTTPAPAAITDDSRLTPNEQKIQAIEKFADELGYPRTAVPYRGKKMLMEKCKKEKPDLFGGGDDPFLDIWKVASKTGRIRIKNREKYLPRK